MREVSDLVRDDAGDDTDGIALLENIYAEASETGHSITDIDLIDLFECCFWRFDIIENAISSVSS